MIDSSSSVIDRSTGYLQKVSGGNQQLELKCSSRPTHSREEITNAELSFTEDGSAVKEV